MDLAEDLLARRMGDASDELEEDETMEDEIERHISGVVLPNDLGVVSEDEDEEEVEAVSVSRSEDAPDDSMQYIATKGASVRFQRSNPKRPKTMSHARYERYKLATTVEAFLSAGGTRADLRNDVQKGFATLGSGRPPRIREASEEAEEENSEDESESESEDDEAPPLPKKAKRAAPKGGDGDDEASPKVAEVRHMLHFYLCQLRWQYGRIVAPDDWASFDAELARLDSKGGVGAADVASCGALMDAFLRGPALGDRWVPWHTTTCEQELFLMTELRNAPDLDDKEKFVLGTAFSASRWCPLWREVILPYFSRARDTAGAYADLDGDDEKRRGPRILKPRDAFRVGGPVFERAEAFRDRGNKLHTRAFTSYPQRGDGGDNYCAYIMNRHAHFAEIGLAAYKLISKETGVSLAALDKCYRSFDRIGPTMSKVLLVTNHLWRPHLEILNDDCEVGDGADEAFLFLYGQRGGGDARRKRRLKHLFDYLQDAEAQALEPRLRPMIAWVAARTRSRFPDIPPAAIGDVMTIYDLQVQLCEWRKFRKNVDKRRTIARGVVLRGGGA